MSEEQLQKIERLSQLLKDGAITQEEFDQQKAFLLNTQPFAPVEEPAEAPKNNDKTTGCLWIIGIIGAFAIYLIMADKVKSPSPDVSVNAPVKIELTDDQKAVEYLSIPKWDWVKTGFGTVGEINLRIRNASTENTFSDIRIEFATRGKSGTILNSREVTIYETVGPGKTIRVKELNVGFIDQQSTNAGIRILGANAR